MIKLDKWNTSAVRLAAYRIRAAKNKHGHNDWREHIYGRGCLFTGEHITRAADEPGKWFTEDKYQIGAYVDDAHKIDKRINHTGWYTDAFCNDTLIGGVARLRTSRGTYYIPVTYQTDCDGSTHWMNHAEIVPRGSTEDAHAQAKRDAARAADSLAESEAEDCREANAKQEAEHDIEWARERIHELNQEALPLLREIKYHKPSPVICKALRSHLARLLAERTAEFKTIAAREDDFWTAVQS
jgi:hypothetical protein